MASIRGFVCIVGLDVSCCLLSGKIQAKGCQKEPDACFSELYADGNYQTGKEILSLFL
jgi:hypothetical protein